MDTALLLARLLLAVTFGIAACMKVHDRAGTKEGLLAFRVPRVLGGPVAYLLPLAELAVAVALVTTATARWGAAAATIVLAAFSLVIGLSLARGQKPACPCFGLRAANPIGRRTLLRNGVLIAVAVFIVVAGPGHTGTTAVSWIAEASAVEASALTVSVLALAVGGLNVKLRQRKQRLLAQRDEMEARIGGYDHLPASAFRARPGSPLRGLAVGSVAPAFTLHDISGQNVSLDDLTRDGKSLLLIFASPTCDLCASLLPHIARWQRSIATSTNVVVVSSGTENQVQRAMSRLNLKKVLLERDQSVSRAYESGGAPTGVLIASDGTIATPLAEGPNAVRSLGSALARRLYTRGAPRAAGQMDHQSAAGS